VAIAGDGWEQRLSDMRKQLEEVKYVKSPANAHLLVSSYKSVFIRLKDNFN
jgi:hypothetical protein